MPVPLGVYIVPTLVLIAGIVVLMNPFQAATVPFIVLGVSSMVYALSDLFRLIRYRRKYAQDIYGCHSFIKNRKSKYRISGIAVLLR